MLIDEDQNPPPTIEESYSTAIGSSNLKHDPDRPGAVQMIIAAGINPHNLGKALMRLRTEWDASAKPIAPTLDQLRALAGTYKREKGGLVIVPKLGGSAGETEQITPLAAAQREAEAWHEMELGRLLQRLKTLPMVRGELVRWAGSEGIEGPQHVVAAVLIWWLDCRCRTCKGVQKRVVEGTGRTSSKDCSKCHGSGELKVPHGFLGRKVLGYMNSCRGSASKHLKETKWRHRAG
jgi:hypothetical protein